MKKIGILLLKVSLSLAIIVFLFWWAAWREDGGKSFLAMLAQPKRWLYLVAAWAVATVGVIITMIRWRYLLQAVGVEFSLRDAFRIGFLGYLFNYAPMGMVGGDLIKAFIIAKEHPGNRPKAIASIIVDRIIGLHVLFLIASAGIFLTGFWNLPDRRDVRIVCDGILSITLVSTVGLGVTLLPGVLESRWIEALSRLPRVGRSIGRLMEGFRFYRGRRTAIYMASLMTVPVHGLFTISVALVAYGLNFATVPSRDYWIIFPASSIASTIPLPVGPVETGIVFFYAAAFRRVVPGAGAALLRSQGLMIALAYRIITFLIAPIGLGYYIRGGRNEVVEVINDEQSGA